MIHMTTNEIFKMKPWKPFSIGHITAAKGMTNVDHSIDAGFEEALRAAPAQVRGQHSSWNFFGYVWFEDGLFHEQVWVEHVEREIITASTLTELMETVNAKYGSD